MKKITSNLVNIKRHTFDTVESHIHIVIPGNMNKRVREIRYFLFLEYKSISTSLHQEYAASDRHFKASPVAQRLVIRQKFWKRKSLPLSGVAVPFLLPEGQVAGRCAVAGTEGEGKFPPALLGAPEAEADRDVER